MSISIPDATVASWPKRCVLKVETDNTVPDTCISMVLLDIDACSHMYARTLEEMQNLAVMANSIDKIIVHSQFAIKTLTKLFGCAIDPTVIEDTMTLSRQKAPTEKSHSLEACAARLGLMRKRFTGAGEWSQYAENHCMTDAEIIALLYLTLTGEEA